MTTILVTGFEPFGDFDTNPTAELVTNLDGKTGQLAPGMTVRTTVLPVSFDRARTDLIACVDRYRPDAVVSCGLHARSSAIAVERIGINVMDRGDAAGLADNDGAEPCDEPIVPDGPDGLFATLPVRAIVDALRAGGIPAMLSNTAGTFVCNAVLYDLLHHLRSEGSPVLAGFLHFPQSDRMAVQDPRWPSMSVLTMRRALELTLGTVARSLSTSGAR